MYNVSSLIKGAYTFGRNNQLTRHIQDIKKAGCSYSITYCCSSNHRSNRQLFRTDTDLPGKYTSIGQPKKEDVTQQMTSQDIQSNLQLINTYNEIIKSPAILSIVSENLDLPLTPTQLASKITVSNANNSQVLNISVQDENYNVAADMANQVVEVFKEEVPKLMNVDNVNILSPAQYSDNPTPIKPNKMLNMAIALVIGLMIGVGLAFLLEYLDTTVKTELDVEEIIGLPIIGVVSPIKQEEMQKSPAHSKAGRQRIQQKISQES